MPAEPIPQIEQPIVSAPERPLLPQRRVELPRPAESVAAPAPAPVVMPSRPAAVSPSPAVPAAVGGVSLQAIESVLSRDLEDLYFQLPPDRQAAFKQKGEEAAQKIKAMFDTAKVNAKKIAQLIVDWLKLIPGVNRYFLEQESKIKTDEILGLKA